MKSTCVLFLVLVALAKADRDWSKVFPNHLKNPPYARNPHGILNPRITGGAESVPNSHPSMAALFAPLSAGTAFCGGSLISTRTILTAAHCVVDVVGPVEVILGAHRVREDEATQQKINSSEIIVHPDWSATLAQNDIALIRLLNEVELNDYIQVQPLASNNSDTFEGQDAIVSGWGLVSDKAIGISEVLREVTIPIIANDVCNESYSGVIRDTHICASGLDGKSTCSGDSGGPLVVDGLQVGIVSFGIIFGCELGWPPAFTRITEFSSWIEENLI